MCIKVQLVPQRKHDPCQWQQSTKVVKKKIIGIYCVIHKKHANSEQNAAVLNAATSSSELQRGLKWMFQKVTKIRKLRTRVLT
jgi:hypothetical protein